MRSTTTSALAAVAVLGILASGCGGGNDTAGAAGPGSGDTGAGSATSGPLRTVDDVVAVLEDAGLCAEKGEPTSSGALYGGQPELELITKTVSCDPKTAHAVQVSGFATAQDRDQAASHDFGDLYHYVGTGENLWVLEVGYTDGKEPVEQVLGDQMELVR